MHNIWQQFMPIIPPVIDEHGQHHEVSSVETFNYAVRLRVVRCSSSLRASQKGTQRFHKSILELPPLVAMNNQRHTKSLNNLLDQDIRHRVGTFILYRESFRPLTEMVSDHQNVAVAVRCRITECLSQYDPSDDRSEYYPTDDVVQLVISS